MSLCRSVAQLLGPGGVLWGGGVPKMLKGYASWYFWVYARVRLLRRESSTCGQVGGLPTRWVGGETGRFKKLREVGSQWGLTAKGKLFLLCKSGTVVLLLLGGGGGG